MNRILDSSLRNDLRRLSDFIDVPAAETPRLKEGERRDVAVLFLDLKDFTSMSEGMDSEVLYEMIMSVMKILTDVIEGYGGYVDKIQGDSIMALFGARKANEKDSVHAVSCGRKMIETIGEVNDIFKEIGVTISARVGISYGTVTVAPDPSGHLTAIGDVVNLASRLESQAATDSILVSGMVMRQCGNLFEWQDLGVTGIRGLKESIHVYSPTGPGSIQKARWERAARVARSPMVGRQHEMSLLAGLWKLQTDGDVNTNRLGGSRHICAGICGEAGIGKSRLIHEFLKNATNCNESIHLLVGKTLSYAQQPFWLWITLLRSYFGIDMGMDDASDILSGQLDKLVEQTGDETLYSTEPYLASLFSIRKPGDMAIETDDENRHRKTMMVIRSLVQAIASTARTVLILEDLHWIDSASRETLEFLIANCRTDKPLLFLCLYRPLWESSGSIFESITEASAEKLELILDIVPDEGCRELIRHMLDSKPHEDVEDFLITRSGGNPFFLEELILDLIETGALEENERSWCFSSPPEDIYIPSSLNNLIRSRIDRLQPLFRGGLQHCSVLGMDFLMKLYRRLHEKLSIEGRPDEIMDELTRRDFLRNVDDSSGLKYIFRHFLIHDSAYDTLLHRNRRVLHRFAAEALEELFAGESEDLSPVIAHHWERTGNMKMSLLWGLKALATCRKTYQNQEGLNWVNKLSAWLEKEPRNSVTAERQFSVFEAKQSILCTLGRREEQELAIREMFEVVKITEDKAHLAQAYSIRGQYLSVTGKMSEAQADFDRAMELTSDEAHICLLMGENYFRRSMYAESLECYRKVIENTNDFFLKTRVELSTAFICRIMGRTTESEAHLIMAGDLIRENEKGELPLLRARYYTRLADFESANSSTESSIHHYGMAIDLYRNCGDMAGEAMVLNNMHWIYSQTGDYEKSLETLEEVVKIDEEIDEALGIAIAYYNIAETYMEMGRLDDAEEYYRLYLELSEEIDNDLGEGYGTFGLGYLHMERGDLLSAEKFFTESSEVFGRLGGKEMETVVRIALITLYLKDDRTDDARRILESLDQGSFSTPVQNSIHFMQGLVESKSSSGKDENALESAVSHFISSVGDPDHCNRIEIAERYTSLASVLALLGREEQRLKALARGSEMLAGKLQMVYPRFRKMITSRREICSFMELCSEAGVPVIAPEPVSDQS